MKKLFCAALCVVLALVPLCAVAAARLPQQRGTVTDDADVLSAQTVADIGEYAKKVEDETELRLHVAVVHFLDGLDAQTYADTLFAKWKLGDKDMLLLGAAGEDSFAAAMGKDVKNVLGEKNAENLLYTSSRFSTLFRTQQYDAAFADYFAAFNALAEKQTGKKIRMGNLFGGQTAPKAEKPAAREYGSQLWSEVMNAITDSTEDYQEYHEKRPNHDNGLTPGGWVVLAILILIIFGQSDPVRKRRRARGSYRSYGCGCSPLGWIFSMIGLNVIIDAVRGRK